MNFETPLTTLVWLTSIVSVALTYVVSYMLIPRLGGDPSLWWKLSTVITCGTLAGRDHSGAREGLHVDRVGARRAKSSSPRARAARRSTCCRGSWPATSAPTGWAW